MPALATAALLVASVFYFWTMDGPLWSKEPAGFYGFQTAGFRAGHLHIAGIEPHPKLAELENPYWGDQNRAYRVLDLSYYRGKYYSYFGVGPIVFLTLPWAVTTGTYLTEPGATLILLIGGCGVMLVLLEWVRRRHFPNIGPWVLCSSALLLCFGSLVPIHLIGVNAGTVAQSGAYLCFWAAFLCLALLPDNRHPVRLLAAASLWCGLALSCRPSFLPITAMMLPAAFWLWKARQVPLLSLGIAMALPLGVVAAALLCYNYARFDSIWEFGNRLQLTDLDYRQVRLLSTDFLWSPRTLDLLLRPPQSTHFFPFIANTRDLVPIGLLWVFPTSVFAVGAFWWGGRIPAAARARG
jgi:hypothetical protein